MELKPELILFTQEEALVLTVKGFYLYWHKVWWSAKEITREMAYEITESKHLEISGERKYCDFSSFDRSTRREQKKW